MKKYNHILGKTKKEVLAELGDEFNFFPADVWTYTLINRWWQKKKILCLYFEDERVAKIIVQNKGNPQQNMPLNRDL